MKMTAKILFGISFFSLVLAQTAGIIEENGWKFGGGVFFSYVDSTNTYSVRNSDLTQTFSNAGGMYDDYDGGVWISADWKKDFVTNRAVPDQFSFLFKHLNGENLSKIVFYLGIIDSQNRFASGYGDAVDVQNGDYQKITFDMRFAKNAGMTIFTKIVITFTVKSKEKGYVLSRDNLKDLSSIDDTLGTEILDFGTLTGINIESNNIPETFTVSQNYPNPFNPSTTIKFAIPQQGNVKIEVYDIMGKLINTLINKDMNSGSYTVTWDGKNNSGQQVGSGVYLYRIQAADNFNAVKKMILLK